MIVIGTTLILKQNTMNCSTGALSLSSKEFVIKRHTHHAVIVPVSNVNKAVIRALAYAKTLSDNVSAVHVNVNVPDAKRIAGLWNKHIRDVPLLILASPGISVIGPFKAYIEEVLEKNEDGIVTIVFPEIITKKWWQGVLHNRTTHLIKKSLWRESRIIIISVPFYLE